MDWIFSSILIPALVIGVLVFVHELGHFLLAKFCGVGVLKFSVGFGPAIFRFTHKETQYQLSIIPLGGFVRMVGDIPDAITGPQETDDAVRGIESKDAKAKPVSKEVEEVLSNKNYWFIEKSLWQRSAIVFAGPLFNAIFAVFCVMLAVNMYGQDRLLEEARLGEVMEGSPAEAAGLKVGDLVTSMNGAKIETWEALAKAIHSGKGGPVNLLIDRGGEQKNLVIVPEEQEFTSDDGKNVKSFLIGIKPTFESISPTFIDSIGIGIHWTYAVSLRTYEGLWGMFVGEVSPKDLAGPLFIFDAASKQAKKGFENILYFMAILSVSLCVLNLLPIPILDGGHLLFFFIEALFGPISIRKKEFAQQVGMMMLLGLMVFAVHNDISREAIPEEKPPSWKKSEVSAVEGAVAPESEKK